MSKSSFNAILFTVLFFGLTMVPGGASLAQVNAGETVIGVQFHFEPLEIIHGWNSWSNNAITFANFYDRTPHCNRPPRLHEYDGIMVARTFTPCMAEAVLSVVNEHVAELGPPLSVRFESRGVRPMTSAELSHVTRNQGFQGYGEFLNHLRRTQAGETGVINVWMVSSNNDSRHAAGGTTFANQRLRGSSPATIVMVIDQFNLGYSAYTLAHELGHLMGLDGHLTDDLEFRTDAGVVQIPSFTTLQRTHGITSGCEYLNIMGSFSEGCSTEERRNITIGFNTPIHGDILRDVFTGWLYNRQLAPLPRNWPQSAQ